MSIQNKPDTRMYDLFKAAVALALCIVLVFLLIRAAGKSEVEEPETQGSRQALLIPVPGMPQLSGEGGVSLSGTGEPGSTVELWTGDVKLGSAAVGEDGTWSFQSNLRPGEYSIVARAIGVSGEVTNQSEAFVVSVPVAVVKTPPILNESRVDSEGKITLGGVGEAGQTLDIMEDGVVVGKVTVSIDGTWGFVYKSVTGERNLVVRYQNQPSLVSAEARVEVKDTEGRPAIAQVQSQRPVGGYAYVVKGDDWLANLARTHLGSAQLYPLIIDATNAKATEDSSFAMIMYPDFIRPGWKIWIPGP